MVSLFAFKDLLGTQQQYSLPRQKCCNQMLFEAVVGAHSGPVLTGAVVDLQIVNLVHMLLVMS